MKKNAPTTKLLTKNKQTTFHLVSLLPLYMICPYGAEHLFCGLCPTPQANAIGRSAKTVREFLEKHWTDELAESEHNTIKLAVRALLEVVQSGAKNIELAVMRKGERLKVGYQT